MIKFLKKNRFILLTTALILFLCIIPILYNFSNNSSLKKEIFSFIKENNIEMSKFYVSDGYINRNAYIAHGGGINEFTYTNCLEAIQDSIDKKFKFIEIDMLISSDGHIVGGHDWKLFRKMTGIQDDCDSALDVNTIKSLKIKNQFTPILGKDILNFMKKNDFILITDKIRDYKLLTAEIPLVDRMIVEVFSPEDYLKALQSGVKFPAYRIKNKKHFEIAQDFSFPIVTMDANSFFNDDSSINNVQILHNSGVTILLYYTEFRDKDKPEFIHKYLGKTVSKIYTDSLSPINFP